jgi:hypothetical protein
MVSLCILDGSDRLHGIDSDSTHRMKADQNQALSVSVVDPKLKLIDTP